MKLGIERFWEKSVELRSGLVGKLWNRRESFWNFEVQIWRIVVQPTVFPWIRAAAIWWFFTDSLFSLSNLHTILSDLLYLSLEIHQMAAALIRGKTVDTRFRLGLYYWFLRSIRQMLIWSTALKLKQCFDQPTPKLDPQLSSTRIFKLLQDLKFNRSA
jgi:hypothetical protein